MEISKSGNTTSITLTVLIVEDTVEQAINLKNAVEGYESVFHSKPDINGNTLQVQYKAIVNGMMGTFEGTTAFTTSQRYLSQSIKTLDIVLCDYDLGGPKGSDLLANAYKLERGQSCRVYKVLHSVGSENFKFQNEPHVDFICDSKKSDDIKSITLRNFEEKILQTILFGNPHFYPLFYEQCDEYSFRLKNTTLLDMKCRGIPVYQILYVYAIKSGFNKFKYRTEEIQSAEKEAHFALIEYFETELFMKIGPALYINKLWLGHHNAFDNSVKFIMPGDNSTVLYIDDIQVKKKQKINLTSFLLGLWKGNKSEFPEFELPPYFKL